MTRHIDCLWRFSKSTEVRSTGKVLEKYWKSTGNRPVQISESTAVHGPKRKKYRLSRKKYRGTFTGYRSTWSVPGPGPRTAVPKSCTGTKPDIEHKKS